MTTQADRDPTGAVGRTLVLLVATVVLAAGCGHARFEAIGVPTVDGDGAAQLARARATLARGQGDATTWATLAAVLLHRGDLDGARAAARRGLALDPERVGATLVAARVEARADAPDAALALYARALAGHPGVASAIAREHADVLIAVAERAARAGEGDHAALALADLERLGVDQAERLRPRRAAAWLGVAAAFSEQGVAERAQDALERARGAGADAGELAFADAALLDLGGDPAAPERLAAWASRLDVGARWTRVGDLHRRRGREVDAEDAYRRAAAARPEDPAPWEAVARAALARGDADAARDATREAAARALARDGAEAALSALRAGADRLNRAKAPRQAADLLAAAAALAPVACAAASAPGSAASTRDDCVFMALDDAVAALVAAGRGAECVALATAWVRGAPEVPLAATRAARALTARGLPDAALTVLGGSEVGTDVTVELARVEALTALTGDAAALARARAGALVPPDADPSAAARAAADALEARLVDPTAPSDPALRARLALARVGLRDLVGASRIAASLDQSDPDLPYSSLVLAAAALVLRRSATEALRVLDAGLPRAAQAPSAALAVATWCVGAGLTDRARPWFEAAAASPDPATRSHAHDALSERYLEGPEPSPERALAHLMAWVDLVPVDRRPLALSRKAEAWGRLRAPTALARTLDALRLALTPDDEALHEAHVNALISARRWDDARAAAGRWIDHALHPSAVAARVGERLRREGQADAAAALLSRSAPEQTAEAPWHAELARFFERRGDLPRARRHAEAFIAQAAQSRVIGPTRLLTFAEELLDRGQLDLALRAARDVLRVNDDSIKALQVAGRALLRQGEDAEAAQLFDAYVAAGTRTAKKRLEDVGRVYLAEGRLAAAAALLERRAALEQVPNLAIFNELANLYRQLGDLEALERVARDLVARAGGTAAQRFYEAAAARLTDAGAVDAAARLWRLGMGQEPRDRRLVMGAFDNAVLRGDGAAARELGLRLASGQGDSGPVWTTLATKLLQGGLPADALALLDAGVAAVPGLAALRVQRAKACLALGDVEGAHADFALALSLAASAREVLDEAEGAYRGAHQEERLRDLQARALASSPGRSEHLIALGASLLRAGRAEEGRQLLLRHLSQNERGELAVARAFLAAGAEGDALIHFGRAFDQVNASDAAQALTQVAALLERRGEGERLDEPVRLYLLGADGGVAAPNLVAVATAYRAAGRPADALAWYERSDEAQPSAELAFVIGGLRDALGDDAGARAAFARFIARAVGERAVQRGADPLPAGVARVVERYLAAGRAPAALDFLAQAAAAQGASPWLALMEARVRVRSGDPAGALAAVSGPLPAWSSDRPALALVRALIDDLLDRGDLAEAGVVTARALAAGWDPALGLAALRVAARRGLPVEAAQAARALQVEHGPSVLADVGAALAAEGLQREAVATLTAAVTTPGAPRALEAVPGLARLAPTAPAPWADGAGAAGGRGLLEGGVMAATWAFARGEYRAALAALERPLTLAPRDDGAWRLALRAAAQLGDPTAVAALLARLERRPGEASKAVAEAAVLLRNSNEPEFALLAVDRYVALRRDGIDVAVEGVALALAAGRPDDAANRAAAVLAMVGDDPATRLELAERYLAWLYPEQARAHLVAAAGATGALAMRREGLAVRLGVLAGDAAEVRRACEAWRALSDEVSARVACAEVLAAADAPPELVREQLGPVLAGALPPRRALVLAAQAAWQLGEVEAARSAWGRLVALHPWWTDPWPALLAAAVAAQDVHGAQAVLAHGRRAGGLDLVGLARVAAEALPARSAPEGVELVAGLIVAAEDQAGTADPEVAAAWARLLAAAGDSASGARAALEAAWAQAPRSTAAANSLAWVLTAVNGGDPARALVLADEALALGPPARPLGAEPRSAPEWPTATVLDTRAWALHRLGREHEALSTVTRALRLVDESEVAEIGEVVLHRAEILTALGRSAEALTAYRDCARRGPATPWGRRCRGRVLEAVPR